MIDLPIDVPPGWRVVAVQDITSFEPAVGTAALLLGIFGGFWLYNELLNQACNAVFHTTSPASDMLGLSLFSAVGLSVIVFKLNEWLTRDTQARIWWPSKR